MLLSAIDLSPYVYDNRCCKVGYIIDWVRSRKKDD